MKEPQVPISVAYDVTSLAENRYGGISEVCRQILTEASRNDAVLPTAVYRHGHPANIDVPSIDIKRIGPLTRFSPARFDIVHALGHRLPPVRGRKLVYTLHDAWSLRPNRYQSEDFQSRIGPRMIKELRRVDAVLSVSEATQDGLLKLGIVDPGRCFVVPNGVTEPGPPAAQGENGEVVALLGRPYVLFVGRLEVRKNLDHVIEAVLPVAGMGLVLVGEGGYGGEEIEKLVVGRFPEERLHRFARLLSADLDLLYRHAVAALQPSWEEGFGLPVLEAMIRGCPVITSNCSGSAEVAADAAILVDPAEPLESTTALERLIDRTELRERLISAGRERAAKFSIQSAFERTADVYRQLLQA
jgi:glycosyltransferase involved in cell wall biosynthesis